MITIKSLREKRGGLLTQAEALSQNPDTLANAQSLLAEIKALDTQIETLTSIEALKASRTVDPNLVQASKKHLSMRHLITAVATRNIDGFLAELHSEGQKQMGAFAKNNSEIQPSILIPVEGVAAMAFEALKSNPRAFRRFMADMTSTGQSSTAGDQGGDTLDTIMAAWSEYLFNKSVLANLGATVLTGLTANYNLTRGALSPTFAWEGETDANAEATPNTGKTAFNPKRAGGFIDLSNMLSIQNSSFQGKLADALLKGLISFWEAGAINGGGNTEPTGIIGTSGVGSVFAGGAASDSTNTAGAAPVWKDLVNLEKEVAIDNADVDSMAYLTNAKVRAALKDTKKDSGSGIYLWPETANATLNGYRTGVTNNVPSNITKGGSGATLSAIIFGDFSKLFLGQWGGMEVMLNPYTKMGEGITQMFINAYVNAAVIEPRAFAVCDDVVAA